MTTFRSAILLFSLVFSALGASILSLLPSFGLFELFEYYLNIFKLHFDLAICFFSHISLYFVNGYPREYKIHP